jgi:tetratricopeptide (TPR) repeat protein
MLLVASGCESNGSKNEDLSWKEALDQGKRLRSDESTPAEVRFAAAEEAYRIAMEKLQDMLGKKAVSTHDMRELFNELESVLRTQGKEVEVEQVLKTKISLYTKHLGREKMLTGAAHEALANIYKKTGRNQLAVEEYGKAMRVYKANNRAGSVAKMKARINKLKTGNGG